MVRSQYEHPDQNSIKDNLEICIIVKFDFTLIYIINRERFIIIIK